MECASSVNADMIGVIGEKWRELEPGIGNPNECKCPGSGMETPKKTAEKRDF